MSATGANDILVPSSSLTPSVKYAVEHSFSARAAISPGHLFPLSREAINRITIPSRANSSNLVLGYRGILDVFGAAFAVTSKFMLVLACRRNSR